jgi:protein-L-isoaspartate(D-aspartate) O-methyltransferase
LVQRRQFIAGAAGLIAGSLAPRLAMADVPTPFTFDMAPPTDNREKFIAWGVAQRGEEPKYLGERFDRFGAMVRNEDLANDRNKRAFLLTPREKFVLQQISPAPMTTPFSTSATASRFPAPTSLAA